MNKLQAKYAVIALISKSGNLIICGTYTFNILASTKLTTQTLINGVLSDPMRHDLEKNLELEEVLALIAGHNDCHTMKVIHREVDNLDDAKLYVDSILHHGDNDVTRM